MKKLLSLAALVALPLLQGCASMNMAECQTADWQTIGYQDGAKGSPSSSISRHRKACSKHGITPDLERYVAGWNEGVRQFCTPQSGFNAGNSGSSYAGVCPADLEGDFLLAYGDGKQLYTLHSNARQLSHQISRNERRLDTIKDEITRKEARLIASEETTAEQRARLVADLKDLAEETGELEISIRDLEYELGRAEVELENYRADIALEYGL